MKIPNSLKIKRSTWKVRVGNIINKQDAVGLCNFRKKEITLSPDQDKEEMLDTLLHELLHSAFPNQLCGIKLEERIVSALTPKLLQILRDNKLKFW